MDCSTWKPHNWSHIRISDNELRSLAVALKCSHFEAALYFRENAADIADRICLKCKEKETRLSDFIGKVG